DRAWNDDDFAAFEAAQRGIDDIVRLPPEEAWNFVAIDADHIMEFAVGEAGAERLHFYFRSGAAEFHVKAEREGGHPGFGGAVADVAFRLAEAGDRRYVDDRAVASRDHVGERRVGEAHGGHDVKLVHLFLTVEVGGPEAAEGAEACVVDQEF